MLSIVGGYGQKCPSRVSFAIYAMEKINVLLSNDFE